MTENEQAILKGLRAADDRDRFREECRQMREDITALVQRAEKAEAERDAAQAKLQCLSCAAGLANGSTPPEEYRLAAVATAERNMELEKQAAALREACSRLHHWHCWGKDEEGMVVSAEVVRSIWDTVQDTAAAAAAYEARIRADERRKVLEEVQNRLMLNTDTLAWMREQLATLESEGV